MDLSLFTSFEGRINRQKWWLGIIVLIILEWIMAVVLGMLVGRDMMVMDPANPAATTQAIGMLTIPMFIVALIFLWPSLALYTKRWHDRGKSGWWTLILLIPIIGAIWALV
ncbi:MAG TPA: DUF805 domain-containing protein [Aestuariivirga sp.]|nr:DUF805 domain-containing protein [Aestuariivirga sp.]